MATADWNQDEEALAEVYQKWETEDLVRAVTVDAMDYTPEALRPLRQELARRNVAVAEQQIIEGVERERNKEFVGVGGFLLWLLLVLGLNSIRALTSFPRALAAQTPPLVRAYSMGRLALGVLGITACVLLVARNRRAPRWAAGWLILNVILNVALMFLGGSAMLLLPVLVSLVWLCYVFVSKRVKATYGGAPAEGEIDLFFPPDSAQEGNPYAPPGSRRSGVS